MRMIPFPTRFAIASAAALSATLIMASPVMAERLNDEEVKGLIERIDKERDRFEDQLDAEVKRSTIRNADRELNVERYLDELEENVDRVKDGFSSSYSASAEVTTLLRQGSDIHRAMAARPPAFDGASEWARLSASLSELAVAYGTVFPLAPDQQARRMNDREVRTVADEVVKNADSYRKELDASLKTNTTIDKATYEAAVKEAQALHDDAKSLASAVDDRRPATGEARSLLDRTAALKTASASRSLSPAAQTAWTSVESGVSTLAQAFGMQTR
jgi:hypothetical protein